MLSSKLTHAMRRPVTAFCHSSSLSSSSATTRLFAPASTRLFLAKRSYSHSTIMRTQGKDQGQELKKMAGNMNLSEEELRDVLVKRLQTMDDGQSEKAEYIDWLLGEGAPKARPATANKKPPVRKQPSPPPQQQSSSMTNDDDGTQTFSTNVLFAERNDLHPKSKRAITEVMGLSSMTEIQAKTFAAASSGRDVLGRARTGTGKTLAFLLPAIERILQSDDYVVGENIGVLVISPTRELATQIGDQAEKLLSFHRDMNVQVVFGGTNMKRDVNRLSNRLPTILVATPGRLLDHMRSTKVNGQQFGKHIMSRTPVVVLDETDRLLDMGFRNEIQKILAYLPRGRGRQTLLFSATIPPDLKTIMAQNMQKDFIEVDCINDGDAATHTNAQVKQSHVIIPSSDRFVSSVVEVVQLAMEHDSAETPAKIVVFFPTAKMVAFFSELFNLGLRIPVLELHSKKTQSYRNRVSENFRQATRDILFTSDVSARGVDYPNVSHVIQFGIPDSREQYIHRLGRTGRAGTEGRGWLVLSDWESRYLQELKGLDIPVDPQLREMFQNPLSAETDDLLGPVRDRIGRGDRVLTNSAQGAYRAFLGYYLGKMKKLNLRRKDDLVDIANEFAELTGLTETPAITKDLVGKMGLKGVSGLNIKAKGPGGPGGGRGGPGGRNNSRSRPGHSDGRRAPNNNRQRR